MITHILSEYTTGLLALLSLILFITRSKMFKVTLHLTAGMLFYASLQATGWAISLKMYPLLALMVII